MGHANDTMERFAELRQSIDQLHAQRDELTAIVRRFASQPYMHRQENLRDAYAAADAIVAKLSAEDSVNAYANTMIKRDQLKRGDRP